MSNAIPVSMEAAVVLDKYVSAERSLRRKYNKASVKFHVLRFASWLTLLGIGILVNLVGVEQILMPVLDKFGANGFLVKVVVFVGVFIFGAAFVDPLVCRAANHSFQEIKREIDEADSAFRNDLDDLEFQRGK